MICGADASGTDPVAAHGVEAQPWRAAVVGLDQRRRARRARPRGRAGRELSCPSNFMPSLGSEPPATTATRRKTPAATRLAAITRAGIGAAQKSFTSAPDAPVEAGRLGHRLGHVAAAALVAVADGLLAAAEHVLDRVRVDAVAVEEVDQRQAWPSPSPHRFSSMTGAASASSSSWAGRIAATTPCGARRRRRPGADGQRAGFGGDGLGVAGVAGRSGRGRATWPADGGPGRPRRRRRRRARGSRGRRRRRRPAGRETRPPA